MWLHDLFRAYFGTANMAELTDAQREIGIAALRVDFEREKRETHKLILWTILLAVDAAPCPSTTHLDGHSRYVARRLMRRMKARDGKSTGRARRDQP